MRTYAVAIGVALTLAAPTDGAQQATDLKKVLYSMANSLGMLRTLRELDSVMTVELWGSGTVREVGPKSVGPAVQVKSYYVQLAYDFPGMRVDMTRASGEREIQVVSGKFAWNEIEKIGGGLEPGWGSAVPAMDAVADRLLRLWTTPFGVVKAATAAGERVKLTVENGATVVTFPLISAPQPGETVNMVVGELEGTPVKVTLDANSRPARVEVRYRDRMYVTSYSGYGDLNESDYKADIYFPARVVRTVDGQTVLDLTIEKTNTYNPYVIMPVPPNVQKVAGK
ncbi:MAG TPA: hypothetical protein VJA65_01745 [bacterium]|nr:hypothetical protein [bacterium]